MSEVIAKRYIKALKKDIEGESLSNLSEIFSQMALSFKDRTFKDVMSNPNIRTSDKVDILLDSVKSAKSEELNNFIKLLGENKRLNIIPSLAVALKKDIAQSTNTYNGVVYSDGDIDSTIVKNLGDGLGKKYNSQITLEFIKNDYDGVKVDVEDLGIEINFSKSRINDQIIEHIAKAI